MTVLPFLAASGRRQGAVETGANEVRRQPTPEIVILDTHWGG